MAERNENGGWMDLRLHLFVSGVNQGNEPRISLCYPRSVRTPSQPFRERGRFSECGVFVDN